MTDKLHGMVDVGAKDATVRTARAQARITLSPEVVGLVREGAVKKGDVFEQARVAGIMAAKKTPALLPLCHPLPLDRVTVEFELQHDAVLITAEAKATAKTGVEMEALVAAAAAALTIYDMCKMYDTSMEIGGLFLLKKTGGASGDYARNTSGDR